jgi:hypothetical protein
LDRDVEQLVAAGKVEVTVVRRDGSDMRLDNQKVVSSRDLVVIDHNRYLFETKYDLYNPFKKVEETTGAAASQDEPTDAPRQVRLHRERCRAIAQMLWDQDPKITIADMIHRDEINKYGCEEKLYSEKTLRTWINDLAPDRSPGRRPKQTS